MPIGFNTEGSQPAYNSLYCLKNMKQITKKVTTIIPHGFLVDVGETGKKTAAKVNPING